MGVFATPPPRTQYDLKPGNSGVGVGALQLALGELGFSVVVSGSYNDATVEQVVAYQRSRALAADGVAGQKTQTKIADDLGKLARQQNGLPVGLIYGLIEAESGFWIDAVNWSVPGGVDCGYTQRRVYGPPWSEAAVAAAFDSQKQITAFAKTTKARHDAYMVAANYPAVQRKPSPDEYAWRLAALFHNWQYGASRLAQGYELSTQPAGWIPRDAAGASRVHFSDGQRVETYRDWAAYYAMGSKLHGHRGQVVRFAFGVPPWDFS